MAPKLITQAECRFLFPDLSYRWILLRRLTPDRGELPAGPQLLQSVLSSKAYQDLFGDAGTSTTHGPYYRGAIDVNAFSASTRDDAIARVRAFIHAPPLREAARNDQAYRDIERHVMQELVTCDDVWELGVLGRGAEHPASGIYGDFVEVIGASRSQPTALLLAMGSD